MTNLGPLDTYLAKQSAATEMVGRIDTLTKDINRRIESARLHELQAEEDRAAATQLDRIRHEYETARTAYVQSQVAHVESAEELLAGSIADEKGR